MKCRPAAPATLTGDTVLGLGEVQLAKSWNHTWIAGTWFVLKTPREISAEQINAFARLYPHDVRPPQPPNGRIVEESQ